MKLTVSEQIMWPSERDEVLAMSMEQLEARAIALLRLHEPPEGYYLAFSGGKDSCVIKELAKRAGVKFDAHYGNTTIDPPELVRFIKKFHALPREVHERRRVLPVVGNCQVA